MQKAMVACCVRADDCVTSVTPLLQGARIRDTGYVSKKLLLNIGTSHWTVLK